MELRSKICPCFLPICILCVYIFCRDHNWITNKVEVKCYPKSRLIDIFLLLLWLNELLRKNCCTPLRQIYNSDNEVTGLVEEPAYSVVISEHLDRDYQLSLHKINVSQAKNRQDSVCNICSLKDYSSFDVSESRTKLFYLYAKEGIEKLTV